MTHDGLPTHTIAENKVQTNNANIKRRVSDYRTPDNNAAKEFVPPDGGVQVSLYLNSS